MYVHMHTLRNNQFKVDMVITRVHVHVHIHVHFTYVHVHISQVHDGYGNTVEPL